MSRRRRPKLREPARAGDLLDKILQGLGLDQRVEQYQALIVWNDVVGPQIAAHTRPTRIRDGVLDVNVDHPAWMQQLQLMKPKILHQLNKAIGKSQLKDIYLKRGTIKAQTATPTAPPPAWKAVRLDEQEKRQVTELISTIDDPELRVEMENFLQKQMRLIKAAADNSGKKTRGLS
ncbi:MAG: DUF721 domain-containing protein [Desulfuromonadales bacterium]